MIEIKKNAPAGPPCAVGGPTIRLLAPNLPKVREMDKRGSGQLFEPPRSFTFFLGPSRFRPLGLFHPKPVGLEESMRESIFHPHDL